VTKRAEEPAMALAGAFSSPNARPTPWADGEALLEDARIYWLTTVRPDGRPHVTPLFAVWLDGVLYFCTGAGERKAKNLTGNARCAVTTGCNAVEGLDVVVEGEATRVRDETLLSRLAAAWKSKYDWDWTVRDGGFHGAEGNVAQVFAVAPQTAFGFGKGETFSQTRWRF
jgi:nitroimidazol reductase NimA-like FMN-containing flavoprotein (pyridoxamine 5'-phosphate oxidase superfamily)